MDKDTINKILKGTAYTGGGAMAALAINKLIGGTSAKSDILASLIGAGLGGTAAYLDNPKHDFSDNPVVDKLDKIKKDTLNKSDVSFLTAPIASIGHIFTGPKYSSKERGELKERLHELNNIIGKATPEEIREINQINKELLLDDAISERRTDAGFTLFGSAAGATGGYFGIRGIGGKVNKHFNKNVDTAQKLVDTIFKGVDSNKKAQSIAAQLNAFNNAHPINNDKWIIKKLIDKLPASKVTTLLKRRFNNEALQQSARNTATVLQKLYDGTNSLSNATTIPTGKATNAFKDLVSFTRSKGFKHIGALKRFGVGKGVLGTGVAAGALLGSAALAALTNYKGSRDHYIDTKNIPNK